MAAPAAITAAAGRAAAEAWLDAMPEPTGAGWAVEARRAARARLAAMGLPGRRDEYWKFTDPAALLPVEPPRAALFAAEEAPLFDGIERLRIVFVDGVLDSTASDPLALEAVEIQPLAEALASDIHWARQIFGVLEARGQTPVNRPFAALNSAVATEGLAIRATRRAQRPISIIYKRKSDSRDAFLHHVVKVEAGAELTILENGPAAVRLNKVIEAEVADGGRLHLVRAQGRDHERRACTHLFARLGAAAVLKSFALTANGALTRNEAVIELAGTGAIVHLAGAALGDGVLHQDDTVFVTHAAEGCESRQVFKKVLRNGARGVFQGKILVRPGAQRTDGYQISQALLLDADSQFFAKPELEIHADDVKCSHGSTTGAIDEDLLFYLRARGVPRAEAQNLLVLAFLADAIGEIEDARIAEEIRTRLEGWLARHLGR